MEKTRSEELMDRKPMTIDYDTLLNDPDVDMDLLDRCEEAVARERGKLSPRTTATEWDAYFKAVATRYVKAKEGR